LPQAKLGWIAAAGPEARVESALERLELIGDTYLSVSTPMQLAASDLLDCGAVIRRQIAQRVRHNYEWVFERVARAPACRALKSEGGWYAVLQVPSLQPEEDLVLDLLQRDHVLTHPGYFFDFSRESYVIVSLLVPESRFAEGIDRIARRYE
jgi:aspartate/methionine/tyrosine aminotransferase